MISQNARTGPTTIGMMMGAKLDPDMTDFPFR